MEFDEVSLIYLATHLSIPRMVHYLHTASCPGTSKTTLSVVQDNRPPITVVGR